MSTFINPPPFLAQPAFSRKICFSASSCLCSLLTSHSNGPQIEMHFSLCSSLLEIRSGCWPFLAFVLSSSFKWKVRSNLNVHLVLFIIFWTHCFFINPLDASILRDTNVFLLYRWLWFFSRANIYSIEASFLERYCWASAASSSFKQSSHKPHYIFCYFPATLEGNSVLVPFTGEGAWNPEQVRQE